MNYLLTVTLGQFRTYCSLQSRCETCAFKGSCNQMLVNDPAKFSKTLKEAMEAEDIEEDE